MPYKLFGLLLATTFCCQNLLAQNNEIIVTTETDKLEYKLNEPIRYSCEINSQPDSIHLVEFDDFVVFSGPNLKTSMTLINGIADVSKGWNYILQASIEGNFTIESPTLFVDGKAYKGNPIEVKISKEGLSEESLEKLEYSIFVRSSRKEEGTTRYILNEKFAYQEVFKNGEWTYTRQLTKKEFKTLRKLNK